MSSSSTLINSAYHNFAPLDSPFSSSSSDLASPSSRVAQFFTAPSSIALNLDILFLVLSLVDNVTLSQCALVCKAWQGIAMSLLWRDALPNGLRPMLLFLDSYYDDDQVHPVSDFSLWCYDLSNGLIMQVYKKRRAMLSRAPLPSCWTAFERNVGQYICSLTLDFKSLVVSDYFLQELAKPESSPIQLHLPNLWKLRAIVNQNATEFDLVLRFVQPTVRDLELDIWDPVWSNQRALHVMQRETEKDIPRFKHGSQPLPAAFPLPGFFAAIADLAPNLTHLAFTMREETEMRDAWQSFVEFCFDLGNLQSLELPLYALTPAALRFLARHPTLERLVMYKERTRKYKAAPSEPFHDIPFVPDVWAPNDHPDLDTKESETLTNVSLTATPSQCSAFLRVLGPQKLTVLHVNLASYFPAADEANAFIASIAGSCPALQELAIRPIISIGGPPLRPNYLMLHPLKACRNLVSLEIAAVHPSQFTNEEFVSLVSHWRHLKRLVLDHPGIACVEPGERANLSLGAAMQAFQLCCPQLCSLILYVSFDAGHLTADGESSPFTDKYTSLAEVDLCIGTPLNTQPEQVALFLDSVLPRNCILRLHPTTRNIFDLSEPEETQKAWETRRRNLNRFVRAVTLTRARVGEYRKTTLL
ncbi:hypothetical protein NM688_g962 [Phlebia brevispora]|uniref:Uncharacterized protein n=1 Tax=Phlebia brevispora TaxID=194682 RepID=A0ACC1TCZ0_9APHY|nr:hypothetical protein NM688_g962 [Phlebia brevispora]